MTEVLLFHHAQGQTTGSTALLKHCGKRHTSFTRRTSTTAEGSALSRGASPSPRASASARSSSVEYASRKRFPMNSAMRASRSACWPPKNWPRPGREHGVRSCSTRAFRPRNSARHGPQPCPSRSTRWTQTRSSLGMATSTRAARSLTRPNEPNSSSTPASNICSRTPASRHTTMTRGSYVPARAQFPRPCMKTYYFGLRIE